MIEPKIDVVIPCYRVKRQVIAVIEELLRLNFIRTIIVVDDACPEKTAEIVLEKFPHCASLKIIKHENNQGVGGAMISGYQHAFDNDADIVVKVDGDGQMPPHHIEKLINPLMLKRADYVKGNRFFHPKQLSAMPKNRLLGNAILSLINKFSSGYWSIIDPTNGFTALGKTAYQQLETKNIDKGYFFESDMLFQLGIANAVVMDIPMPTIYNDGPSSLNITRVLFEFPPKYTSRFFQRIAFKYFIREFNIASLEILFGIPFLFFGLIYGILEWITHARLNTTTPAGTAMIVGLLVLMGFQLILSALNYDITHEPQRPLVGLEERRVDVKSNL